ncbi:MAG: hypothetical protein KKF44_03605 [Nanoarchaeota archaeon]|nr:hypothetical protein [Nanoarchaeota archaeon]
MLNLLYGTILGYITASVFAGQKTGEKGVIGALIVHYHKLKIHIHHWIIGLLLLVVYISIDLFFFDINPTPVDYAVMGFFIGVIFQGVFHYSDWKKIIG